MRRQALLSLALALACAVLSAQAPAPSIALPNRPDSVKFAAIGDSGTGKRPQFEVAARMADARRSFDYSFVIMLGDNLYGRQRPADFVAKFERPYQLLLDAGVTFHASLGNHDKETSLHYPPWNMNGERYYTFARRHVRFISLDSTNLDRVQIDWLTGVLRSSGEDWKVVYFHHPLYSSAGRHGSQEKQRRALEPLFVRYGVDAVFSGHDHVYERIAPQQGIYYFVAGSAGKLRRGDLNRSALTAAGYDQDNAFMLVEIGNEAMTVQAVSRAGLTVDFATLPKQPRPAAETTPGR